MCFFYGFLQLNIRTPLNKQFGPESCLLEVTSTLVVTFSTTIGTSDYSSMLWHFRTILPFNLMRLLPSILGRSANLLFINRRENFSFNDFCPLTLIIARSNFRAIYYRIPSRWIAFMDNWLWTDSLMPHAWDGVGARDTSQVPSSTVTLLLNNVNNVLCVHWLHLENSLTSRQCITCVSPLCIFGYLLPYLGTDRALPHFTHFLFLSIVLKTS